MANQAHKRILLGVTGGIAAYKSPDLVRRLRDLGAHVRVVMTASAQRFVSPLTFQAVSGEPVRSDLWDEAAEAAMGHIELARWAELVLIAPASASFLARLAHGLADDLLSTLCLATDAPIAVAPAMNRLMWANPATQANMAVLRKRGFAVLGPAEGNQACGETGSGRLVEPALLAQAVMQLTAPSGALKDVRVLITAGPTRENIDPVRYISNRSSGKMGFALAQAARAAGARVTLVSGPVALDTPVGVERIDVESAQQMFEAVQRQLPGTDIFIACAAVADYRATAASEEKIKKTAGKLDLELERTPDILSWVSTQAEPRPALVVGFAAETGRLEEQARAKLQSKRLDLIAANEVGADKVFGSDDNELLVLWPGGSHLIARASKQNVARELIDLIASHYRNKTAHA